MIYNYLKILHILSAGILVASLLYSVKGERNIIQTITWIVILPLALFQLGTGFTMISLNQEALSPFYIKGSVIAFVLALTSWMSFSYFSSSDQKKLLQKLSLFVCMSSILSMIYFMASKL